jgi:hypothetical protein
MRNRLTIILVLSSLIFTSQAQDSTLVRTKKGLSFGVLPVIGYNTDVGFQYGGIVNLFQYGDGSYYPDYKYSIYTEISRTTKGSGINQIFFDSKYLLPHQIRITADFSYLTELALNFYGFNGYDAVYNQEWEDDQDPFYKSRMFYRHQRKFTRFTLDLQGKLASNDLLWLGGIGYLNTKIESVDIEKLNKGKDAEDILPDTTLLYVEYVDWGLIRDNEKNGGKIPYVKTGLVFDTRDNEANPVKGMWSEVLLFIVPKILGNNTHSYMKLAITHRQYFSVVKDKLSFVYRLGYQGTLIGKAPFYMQPYMISSFSKVTTTDGLGGAKTLRGILRNRIVGDGIAFGNLEFRWKFYKTVLWKQEIYLALNAFTDAGMVVNKMEIPESVNKDLFPDDYFSANTESLHIAAGLGFRVAINHNFIVAIDYGKTLDQRDGKDGIYVGIGYLF